MIDCGMDPERERLAHSPESRGRYLRSQHVPAEQREPAGPGLCWCGRPERHQGRHWSDKTRKERLS